MTFSNTEKISIPTGNKGPATPYPSNIVVNGIKGSIVKVVVRLKYLSHTHPSEMDVLLVGPASQRAMLMSDISAGPFKNATLTFDDDAIIGLPVPKPSPTAIPSPTPSTNGKRNRGEGEPLVQKSGPRRNDWSGTYRPTNFDNKDDFGPDLPSVSDALASLSVFKGTDPNGTWKLYVFDDVNADGGEIMDGWELIVTVAPPTSTPTP